MVSVEEAARLVRELPEVTEGERNGHDADPVIPAARPSGIGHSDAHAVPPLEETPTAVDH